MQSLGQLWRRRGRLGKTLLAVGAVAVVLGIVGALSRPSDEDTNAASETGVITTETTDVSEADGPIGCLDAAGLSDAEESDTDLWRGFHESPPYTIVVQRLQTPAKAPTVVAGTYAVNGSFKVHAEGEELTTFEGLEADALVQQVADCLGG